MVHGIGQGIGLRQGKRHTGPPVGHHLARLVSGQVEGHAHFCSLFRELRQIFLGHSGLSGSGNDGRNAVRRHRDAPGHVHDRCVHLPQLGGGLEVHDLGHVGHGTFKLHGLAGCHAQSPDQKPGGQCRRTHGQGQIAHAFPQSRSRQIHALHGPLDTIQRAGKQVHQRQRGKYRKDFHGQTLRVPQKLRDRASKKRRSIQTARPTCRAHSSRSSDG